MPIASVLHLLVIDDSVTDAETVADVFRRGGYTVRSRRAGSSEDLADALRERAWDLAVAAMSCRGLPFRQLMALLTASNANIPVIAQDQHYDETIAVAALQAGAEDFLPRGRPERLWLAAARILANRECQRDRGRYQQRLQECEERFLTLLDTGRDAVAYIHDGVHVLANRNYMRLFGLDNDASLEDQPVLDLVSPTHLASFRTLLNSATTADTPLEPTVVRMKRADGKEFDVHLGLTTSVINGESCVQITAYQEAAAPSLEPYATMDSLTGVYNSQYFLDRLEKAVTLVRNTGEDGALVYIELDQFQIIKEKVGIAAGDHVLKGVAGLITGIVADAGTLARLSGDVFTWLINGRGTQPVLAVAEQIRRGVEESIFTAAGRSVTATCSIGVAAIDEHTRNSQTALTHADVACAVARNKGGNRVHLFDARADQDVGEEVDEHWVERVQAALEQNLFQLVYMPIVSLHAHPGEKYEVLLRMKGTGGEAIPPGRFLHAAEQAGLTATIDRWVVRNAVAQLKRQLVRGKKTVLFIKLSTAALTDTTFAPWLRTVLNAAQIPPAGLVFEIDESDATTYLKEAKFFIDALASMGCGAALEHFGMQMDMFKSLNYLNVQFLKIDGSLIHDLAEMHQQRERIRQIAEKARALGKQTIAEYVQDAGSLALLWQDGVNYIQGFYLQRPEEHLRYDFTGVA